MPEEAAYVGGRPEPVGHRRNYAWRGRARDCFPAFAAGQRFTAHKTDVPGALLLLGQEAHVSFGIEFYGGLSDPVQVDVRQATVSEVVRKILGGDDAYQLSVLHGVVLIRRKRQMVPDGLSHRIPRFEAPRRDLMTVNSQLGTVVAFTLNPSPGGLVGDYPSAKEDVGPFDERGWTAEQLLAMLEAVSPLGTLWYPTQRVENLAVRCASANSYWTLVAY
jgi:hypothetical protein